MMTDNNPEPKTCAKCGEMFGCGAKLDGCWCANLKMSDNAATDLQQRFEDCLCPGCLKEYCEMESSPEKHLPAR